MKRRNKASNGKTPKEKPSEPRVQPLSGEASFDFIKGAQYRPIHVDGAFGGLGPTSRYIHMAVYSERRAIPTQITHVVKDGTLGEELKDRRQERKAFIREVEADLIIDLPTAISIRNWLDQRITELATHLATIGEIKPEDK